MFYFTLYYDAWKHKIKIKLHGITSCNSVLYFCVVTKLIEGYIIMQSNNMEIEMVFAAVCGTHFSNRDFRHESVSW